MHKLCEYLDDKLKMLERKVGNGELSNAELEYGDLIAHFKKSLLTNEAMENSGYSEEYRGDMSHGGRMSRRGDMSYDDDMSFARGRTGNVRRDSMRRYSNDGMSYGDAREELIMSLHEYIKTAPEDEKQDARRFMNALKNM
jgi:hypothetical protein